MQNKQALLRKTLEEFVSHHQFIPYFGIELEFYLLNNNSTPTTNSESKISYIKNLEKALVEFSIIEKIEFEQGASQIEIKTKKSANLSKICSDLIKIKSITKQEAKNHNLKISFAAQPFIQDCGSACQFNISLCHKEKNLFFTNKTLLQNAIAGLIQDTDSIIGKITTKKDLIRFSQEINRNLHRNGKYTAPVNISFGSNNRTAAIRIPDIKNKDEKRIEFRIPPANSNPYLNMTLILQAVSKGINKDLANDKNFNLEKYKVFGNAFDPQYSSTLPSLIK